MASSSVVCHSFEPSAKSIAWTHRPVVTHHITTTRRSCLRFLRYPSNELEYVFFSRNTPSHDADADSATTARPVVETRRRPRSRDRRSTRDDDRRERSRDDARAPFATRDAVRVPSPLREDCPARGYAGAGRAPELSRLSRACFPPPRVWPQLGILVTIDDGVCASTSTCFYNRCQWPI